MTDNTPALIGGAESAPTPLDAMKSTKQIGRLQIVRQDDDRDHNLFIPG